MQAPQDLFKGTYYTLTTSNNILYSIEIVIFMPKKVIIANIYDDSTKSQFILYLDTKTYIQSYSEGTSEQINFLNNLLFTVLHDKKLFTVPDKTIVYTLVSFKNLYLGSSVLFHSAKHVFKITCKDNGYQFYLTFGGKEFGECIEIFVFDTGKTILSQVYSEKECGYDSILADGETVDMIKSCLQVAEALFRTQTFIFHDNSQIECGIKDITQSPPRKLQKPYSLTHLHLMKNGKTWYEEHFSAELLDKYMESIYFKNRKELDKPIDISFETLSKTYKFDVSIKEELLPFYEDAITNKRSWKEFFRSIPKSKICTVLLWVPQFIDALIQFQPNLHEWQIPIEKMKRTDMYFIFSPVENTIRGGKRILPIQKKKKSFYIYGFSNRRPMQSIL